jgi:long-chain fatty acid transport protein
MRCSVALLAGLALCPLTAHALGYRFPNQDPEAIARGNAFVATADNPSAIYYNPAGITQLEGQNVRAGVYLGSCGYDYESPTGVKATVDSSLQAVPQLYYTASLKDLPLSFGLGVYAPYGFALDWGQNPPFQTVAQKGKLLYLSLNPVIAWKILPNLSVGIGPTINYSDADVQRRIAMSELGFPSDAPVPGSESKLSGQGWAYGFNAGVRWQPHEKWVLGVNYRSATTVDYHGTAEIQLPPPFPSASSAAVATIRFPQFVVAGISFRPTENWNLEFDLDWADWDSAHQITINSFGASTPWPLNYQSSYMFEFGVTRKLPKNYFVSVGYINSQNSSPDHDFNPIIPDTDLHLGSIGFGYKGKRWDWTAAYHAGYNPGRHVENDVTFPSANGTYRVLNHAFNLAVTLKF